VQLDREVDYVMTESHRRMYEAADVRPRSRAADALVEDLDDPVESVRWLFGDDEDSSKGDSHPMDDVLVPDFRDMMGYKVGLGSKLGIGGRKDFKTEMAESIATYHSKDASTEQRRQALEHLIANAQGWRGHYGAPSSSKALKHSKQVKDDYLLEVMRSAQTELDNKGGLGTAAGSEGWDTHRLHQPPLKKLLASLEEGFSGADDALDLRDAISDARDHGAAALTATRENKQKAQEAYDRAQSVGLWTAIRRGADQLMEALRNHFWDEISRILDMFSNLLEVLDILGIGQLLRAYGYLKQYRVAANRITVLKGADGSANKLIRKVSHYAQGKLNSRRYSCVYLGLIAFVRGCMRFVTLLSAGAAGVVTESINLALAIANVAHEAGRNLKGIYKTVLGNKGIARAHHAQILLRQIGSKNEETSVEAFGIFKGLLRATFTWLDPISKLITHEVVRRYLDDEEKGEQTREAIRKYCDLANSDIQSLLLTSIKLAGRREFLRKHGLEPQDVRLVQVVFIFLFDSFCSRPSASGIGPLEVLSLQYLSKLAAVF